MSVDEHAGDISADFGANEWLIEELYDKYLADASSVDPQWQAYFAKLDGGGGAPAPSPSPAAQKEPRPAPRPEPEVARAPEPEPEPEAAATAPEPERVPAPEPQRSPAPEPEPIVTSKGVALRSADEVEKHVRAIKVHNHLESTARKYGSHPWAKGPLTERAEELLDVPLAAAAAQVAAWAAEGPKAAVIPEEKTP